MIETILGNLIEINIIVNKKTPKGFDSFQKLEVLEAPVHALDTDTKQANFASKAETQTEFPKQGWVSLVTWETQKERKLMVGAMTQINRIYSSNRNGDVAQESINIDMIKLLKDEIVFLYGELSRELRSNQKNNRSLARTKLTLSNS